MRISDWSSDVRSSDLKACIKEDGSVTFDIVVSAAGGTDDVVNTVTFDQFAELQAAGWTVTISDNGADGTLAGFGYAGGTEQTVTFTITLAPPADSDLDLASTPAGLALAPPPPPPAPPPLAASRDARPR